MKKSALLTGLALALFPFLGNSQCTTTNATSCVCASSGSSNCDLLPNMIVARPPLLASGSNGVIEYSQSGNGAEDGRLRVSVSTPNIGHGPLEVRTTNKYICGTDTITGTAPATCPNTGLPPKQLVVQRVYHKNGNTMTYYDRDAGSMTYHPTHGHMHVDDWGIYTLRTATADPNPLNWPIIGTGAKLAFCLMDYGSCSTYNGHCVDSLGNTLLNGNFPNYGLGGGSYNCSPVVQGISSGYTDIYYQYLDGMYITIPPGTCNGNYYIVVQLDPYNYFLEENENDNVIAIPYTLTQQVISATASVTSNATGPVCTSSGVTLSANTGSGYTYLWSNGATSQNITVYTPGNYSVTVTTPCGVATSAPFNVAFIDVAPVTAGSTVCGPASGTVSATAGGATINWYDMASGGAYLGGGNTYTSPVLNSSATYYAEALTVTPGFSGNVQPNDNTIGSGGYLTSSQYLIFDVIQNLTLASVKVYAQAATSTTIELRNSAGTLINSKSVNLPSGESRVTLNWNIAAGANYQITRSGSAALYRNNGGVSYPYTIPNYISITGSSAGSSFYYFFYDWEVGVSPVTCLSNRIPATVTVNQAPNVTFATLAESCNNVPAFALTGGSPAGGTYSGPGVSNNMFDPAVAGIGVHTLSYSYTDGNNCSATAYQVLSVKNCACATPGMPGSIQGLAKVCAGSTIPYQVNNNPNVSSYTWVPPAGATIVSGQGTYSVEVQFAQNYTSGDLCVYANNACGASVARCKTLTKHVALRPSPIVGEVNGLCQTSSGSLSVPPVTYALSYDWTVPAGVTITSGQGTPDIIFSTNNSFTNGQVCVSTSNGCMSSASRCTNIYATPAKGIITGPASVCAGQSGVAYSVTPSTGATVYNWFVPGGSTIASGQGTTNITVNFGSNAGLVKCAAKNACGKRGFSKYSVAITCRMEAPVVQEASVRIQPNPASSRTEMVVTGFAGESAMLTITNMLGKEVVSNKVMLDGQTTLELDLTALSKGVYMVSLNNGSVLKTTRLVVE